MSTVAPNTPTTSWIKDNGTIISVTIDVLIDESGNYFIDESGNNLLDTVSTDGNAPAHTWDEDNQPTTSWVNSFVVTTTVRRTTANGDVRVTVSGDTRISNTSDQNKKPTTTWSEDEY